MINVAANWATFAGRQLLISTIKSRAMSGKSVKKTFHSTILTRTVCASLWRKVFSTFVKASIE
uniref:Uncharacterized protein n=1 Tax=Meloidogyne incognita TaxID=6306 RepID=A0A914M819_MELIC